MGTIGHTQKGHQHRLNVAGAEAGSRVDVSGGQVLC